MSAKPAENPFIEYQGYYLPAAEPAFSMAKAAVEGMKGLQNTIWRDPQPGLAHYAVQRLGSTADYGRGITFAIFAPAPDGTTATRVGTVTLHRDGRLEIA